MKDHPNIQRWLEAADLEVRTLERMGMWVEVPKSEATRCIIPGTWAFRRKRSPDGEVKKYKARFCVRGDLQEGTFDTYSPLVAWSTVRFLLVFALSFDWITTSIDFASAFVQATLDQPVWIHLPRGYRSSLGPNTCLRLVKSLYGLSVAPRLWFEHLSRALKAIGLTQSRYDQCLFYSKCLMLGVYCDDGCIVAESQAAVDEFLGQLRARGFEFSQEENLCEYLGIKFERDSARGTFTLTQQGLIEKIAAVTGLQNCHPNRLPAIQVALGSDPDGPPMREQWSYPSVVGMLLYPSTNTRPDIAFAVSQVARFTSNPRQSHATAIKTIVRYLWATRDKGTIMKPTGELTLDMYSDADFAGLYGREPTLWKMLYDLEPGTFFCSAAAP
jgi:Reverse transcriptase (RNA-dependent DNA polymerase)